MTVTAGYYFGEVDILFGDTRKYTYIADEDCELLSLGKKPFQKIFFQEFREIGNEIYTNAQKRKQRTTKVHKEALEFCEQNFGEAARRARRENKAKEAKKSAMQSFLARANLGKARADAALEDAALEQDVEGEEGAEGQPIFRGLIRRILREVMEKEEEEARESNRKSDKEQEEVQPLGLLKETRSSEEVKETVRYHQFL
jgi:hypothetical protein